MRRARRPFGDIRRLARGQEALEAVGVKVDKTARWMREVMTAR